MRRLASRRRERDRRARLPRRGKLELARRYRGRRRRRLQPDDGRSGRDLHVGAGKDLTDAAGGAGADDRFELHALHDGDGITGHDLVVRANGHGNDNARPRGANEPAVVSGEVVGATVDLDLVMGAGRRRHDAVAVVLQGDPALEGGHTAHVEIHVLRAGAHPVCGGAGPGDVEHVPASAAGQLHSTPWLARRLRPPPSRPGEEAGVVAREIGVIPGDGAGQQGNDGGVGHPPRGCRRAPADRWRSRAGELGQERPTVRDAPVDDHDRLGERPAHPCLRLSPVAAPGSNGGDRPETFSHETVALCHAPVDAHAWPAREPQEGDASCGERVAACLLGEQANGDGMPTDLRSRLTELGAVRHLELQLHEVEPCCHLDGAMPGDEAGTYADDRPYALVLEAEGHTAHPRSGSSVEYTPRALLQPPSRRAVDECRLDQGAVLTDADDANAAVAIDDRLHVALAAAGNGLPARVEGGGFLPGGSQPGNGAQLVRGG